MLIDTNSLVSRWYLVDCHANDRNDSSFGVVIVFGICWNYCYNYNECT